jgi:hypothetical protein
VVKRRGGGMAGGAGAVPRGGGWVRPVLCHLFCFIFIFIFIFRLVL